ncbi:lytic polysaccharide monooxygenase [Shewanella sp. D64]|uniref:lytic polysaccharide monooxygenase n=1 Tax=unclassified Shewanella TaxID=196818 RepID=UPI0022BA4B98|nr:MULTISPECIES: lytic polysaccharide monooxygenase [unclassified Shewanella]MEC4725413.1 lytic polysaccharide monooxygenase [Shewanella sp. D64]MEC4735741.1 lytic polysaccharide monooxygenase [Shewanella sp. E94]WBJ93286.1 lytic polysaccharide monooxygenase [Shewanella sp. MTB7]
MKLNFKAYSMTLGTILLANAMSVSSVNAHGYMDSPKARQQFCVDDGGYWWPDDGSAIPNLACRAALLTTGTKQLVQNNEFSKNVMNYNSTTAVQSAIPNGQLCAGGDVEKSGMDNPSMFWQRSDMTPDADGEITVIFDAHTPHNPSFWEFYLSDETFDVASEVLSWEKLTLIAQVANIAVSEVNGKKVYQIAIPFPLDRSGPATLYTRWQREDAAGEGFYNCSDINIVNDTEPLEWTELEQYIANGLTANEGDEVWFRLFSAQGEERVFEKLAIDSTNIMTDLWARQLAESVVQLHAELVQVGIKEATGDIAYSEDLALNKVWTKQLGFTFRLDVKTPTEPPSGCDLTLWTDSVVYDSGDEVAYNSVRYQAQWWTKNDVPSGSGEWGVWKDLGPCSQ